MIHNFLIMSCLISGHSFISLMVTLKQDSVRKRPPNFRIEIPGDDILKRRILEKIQQVKSCLTSKYNKPVNNGIIIENLLDFWNKHHHENDNDNERHHFPSPYRRGFQIIPHSTARRRYVT